MINYNPSKSARLITELREKRKLSMQDVADRIGVSKTSISKWENEQSKLTTENVLKISKFFNITVEELLQGKLKTEPNSEYIKRNYDLDLFNAFTADDLLEDITPALIYYNHIKEIKNEFIRLLPKYASNSLSVQDKEEFEYISKYFKFDSYYYWSLYPDDRISSANQKKLINDVIAKYKNTNIYNFQISKLYDLDIDLKCDEIIESKSIEAYKAYLSVLTQEQLDISLLNILASKEDNKAYTEALLQAGANVLYTFNDCNKLWFNEEHFSHFEGNISLNENMQNAYDLMSKKELYSNDIRLLKQLSYEEYIKLVNKNKTTYLKASIYKEKDPLKYYSIITK